MSDKKIPILVTDDTLSIRKMMTMFLSTKGFRPLEAENGQKALEVIRADHPSVVLLDIAMPVMSGLETLAKIMEYDSKMPVIMVTANDSKENIKEALNSGAYAFISKPIDFNQLEKLLNEGLRRREIAELKEKTADSSRLIAVGEMAGQVAHEVLNPITAVMTRIEEMATLIPKTNESGLALIKEIVETWNKHYQANNLVEYFKGQSGFSVGKTCAEEDFNDIVNILNEYLERENKFREGMLFLEKSIYRIIKIVDSLRRLSRREGNIQPVDINNMLNEALEIQMDALRRRNIEIERDLDPHIPTVLADNDELIQVVGNLIRNSIYAIGKAHRNPGKISIKTNVTKEAVEIHIGDDGTGIPENVRPKIFDQTFTTKEAGEGTGLGLGISRRIVRRYNGEIFLEWSEMDKGTRFVIQLPINDVEQTH